MDSQASQQASPRNARQHLGGFLDATLEWPYVIVKNPKKNYDRKNLALLFADQTLAAPPSQINATHRTRKTSDIRHRISNIKITHHSLNQCRNGGFFSGGGDR